MSNSIKLDNNNFIDATGVYDHTQGALQSTLNANIGRTYVLKSTVETNPYTFNVPHNATVDLYCGIVMMSDWDASVSPNIYAFRYRASVGGITFELISTTDLTYGRIASMSYSNGVLSIVPNASSTYRFINVVVF